MHDPLVIFAANLYRLRMERGWTQQQLAEASELHLDHISKIENRHREPKARTIAKLAKGLGISAGPLFDGIDGSQSQ